MSRPLICICICTRERDTLLAQAVASLAALERPADHDLALLVVENETRSRQRDTISGMTPGFPVHYAHEPDLGLSNARNRALTEAEALGATWIAFMDDDQIAEPDWIVAYEDAIRANPGRKLMTGPYWYIYPIDFTPFCIRQESREAAGKLDRKCMMGGNCLMHISLVSPAGSGLRFNPARNFSGSEDLEFGLRAARLGQPYLWVSDAVMREALTGHRARFADFFRRSIQFQMAACEVRRSMNSPLRSHLTNLVRLDHEVVYFLFDVLVALASGPFKRDYAWTRFGDAALRVARILGLIRYYTGKSATPYATVAKK